MKKYSFKDLFNEEIKGIEIPIIQRDYAQGRKSESRIRNRFLEALFKAVTETDKHITLDFVYGEIDPNGILIPLDGQQRITTLFLLHWYAAKKENIQENEYHFLALFSYKTRSSARLFCENLIQFKPDFQTNEPISKQVWDQTWYPLDWDNDPTISAMLTMIDSIQAMFAPVENIWHSLTEVKSITFYFIALNDMGLTDDIYIKMNSRGKPLTPFEHFKAEFDKIIQCPKISHKIDGRWTDLLWTYKGSNNTIDDEFMRYFQYISDVICYRNEETLLSDNFEIAEKLYSKEENIKYLEACFDCWHGLDIDAFFENYLSKKVYETGKVKVYDYKTNLFLDCCKSYTISSQSGRREFPLNKTLLLYAFLVYRLHPEISDIDFRHRIRIIRNLIWNSSDEIRLDRMPSLLRETEDIIRFGSISSESSCGYNTLQKSEEIEKLMWCTTNSIEAQDELFHLEDHSMLYGCIAVMGLENQANFSKYRALFNIKNLDLISQTLLCVGDYGQKLKWRYQIGSKFYAGWQALMHPSSQKEGFKENTKETIVQLLNDKESVGTKEELQKIVDTYLQSTDTLKDWRYYFIKYKVIRDSSSYGMYYWLDKTKNNPYEVIIMHTEKKIVTHWNTFLKVIYEDSRTTVSLNSTDTNYDAPILIKGSPFEMRCKNSVFEVKNSDTREITIHPIPQIDGIDIEDRVEFGVNLIQTYLDQKLF